jgi:hypothetical protein
MDKEKKTRDVGFENVKDPNIKLEIVKLVNAPTDATNFIFWYSKTNKDEWGLTLKSIPKKDEGGSFSSQHTWKITWFSKVSEDEPTRLAVANHCKSLAADVTGNEYNRIVEIYKSYRKL